MVSLVDPVVAPGTLAVAVQPVLAADGLQLRPWGEHDAPVVARALADPEIQTWFLDTGAEAEARAWIAVRRRRWQTETGADWAVCAGEAVLGRMALVRLELTAGHGEVGYWTLPEGRGAGVTTRALRALTDWAFATVGLHRLELVHSTRNPGSCGVAGRSGYALEGTARERMLHADGWHDMHVHARLAGDPPPAV